MRWFLLMLCCLLPLLVLANDTRVLGIGGRVVRMSTEDPSVRMVSECVKMDVYPGYYDVAVEFLFTNDGPARRVKMGFPEGGYGDVATMRYRKHTSFTRFQTWVDGHPVKAHRLPAVADDDGRPFTTYWVKDVAFARRQSRLVRVAYRAVTGDDIFGERSAHYSFTGGNWKGKVDSSSLVITMHLAGTNALRFSVPMTRNGNRFAARWTHWQAESEFTATFLPMHLDSLLIHGEPLHPDMSESFTAVLTQPGKGSTPLLQPPAILRDGRPFIALHAWKRYLHAHTKEDTNISWDASTHTATLTTAAHTVRFTLNRAQMDVQGQPPVALPAGPFLSRTIDTANVRQPGMLYVPLQPLVTLWDGSMTVDHATHEVELHIPSLAGEAK